jgi:hypothetical protein
VEILTLSLDSLKELDGGKIANAINLHLKRAANDCYDRPGDKKPRKVSLEISVVPVLDSEARSCSEVKAQVHVASSVPKHRTREISLGLKPNGALVFNPDSPDRIDQTTFLKNEE